MKTMQAYLVLFIFLLFLIHCITHIKQISKRITHFYCLLIIILTTSKIIYLAQTMKKRDSSLFSNRENLLSGKSHWTWKFAFQTNYHVEMANPAFILFSLLQILRQEVCNIQSYINCSQTPNNSLHCVWDEWKLICIYEVKKRNNVVSSVGLPQMLWFFLEWWFL